MYALLKVQKCAQNNFKYSMLTKYASIERNCRHTRRTFLTLGIQKNQYGACASKFILKMCSECNEFHSIYSVCPQFARIYYSSIQENLPRQKIRAGRSQRTNHVSMTHITEGRDKPILTHRKIKQKIIDVNIMLQLHPHRQPTKMPNSCDTIRISLRNSLQQDDLVKCQKQSKCRR